MITSLRTGESAFHAFRLRMKRQPFPSLVCSLQPGPQPWLPQGSNWTARPACLQLLVMTLLPCMCSQPSCGSSAAPALDLLIAVALHAGPGALGQDCGSTAPLLKRSQHPAPRGPWRLSRRGPGQQDCVLLGCVLSLSASWPG